MPNACLFSTASGSSHHGKTTLSAALILLSFLLLLAIPARAELTIYYLRHAEAGHNVLHEWKKKPKETWPEYVGNGDMFTPLGKEQAARVPDKLAGVEFHLIASSPTWRTRNTVLPYLKKTGQKAEIWPELTELSTKTAMAPELPPPTPTLLTAGEKIEIPADEQEWFVLLPDLDRRIKWGKRGVQREADNRELFHRIMKRIRERVGAGEKTVLLVGHGNAGKFIAGMLTDKDRNDYPRVLNTAVWKAKENPDGNFTIEFFNDKPFPEAPLATQPR